MTTFVTAQVASALASSMPTQLIDIVVDYYTSFGTEMSYRGGRLEFVGNEPIQGTRAAFAMRKSDGSVTSWGAPRGGDSSLVQARLKNVKALCAAPRGAFAAIAGDDNEVICWGIKHSKVGSPGPFASPLTATRGDQDDCGDDCPAVLSELKEVEGICGSAEAFAALKRDGRVTTWGSKRYGADSSSVQSRLKGVTAISSTESAFAAVLQDGSVEVWGDQARGGDSSLVASELTEVVLICATESAFAALRKDGTVVSWGDQDHGGSQARGVAGVVAIGSTDSAFAGLMGDGSVVTWGHEDYGGDSSSVAGELKGVEALRGSSGAFAALRSDGTVVTWGHNGYGGDSSGVRGELKGVVSLSSTAGAFAARRSDDTVVTWGNSHNGGEMPTGVSRREDSPSLETLPFFANYVPLFFSRE